MKPIVAVASVLLAASSSAAELSPGVLRLIGDDARLVIGADLDRQANSVLGQFFRSHVLADNDAGLSYHALWIERVDGAHALAVLVGVLPPKRPDAPGEFSAFDANVSVSGDPESVQDAQRRWTDEKPLGSIAAKVRRLAESYDSWFLMIKPFSTIAPHTRAVSGAAAPMLKQRQDLMEDVEELSGGIRFGTVNELRLEAVFRNPEDAAAVATLARWLPGVLQLESADTPPGNLVEAIEEFRVNASGQQASMSMRIPEDKARSLINRWNSRVAEQ